MSFLTMADNNIPITANRDGALYNVALSNQSFIIKDMGDEYAPSVSGLHFSVGTGIAVLKGRHITCTEITETNLLELPTNSSGYVVLRLDLSRPLGTEAYLYATPTLTQENINWNGVIYDMPIATFTSTMTNATIEDVRVIKDSAGGGSLPIASRDELGAIKVGSGLSISTDGTLSINNEGIVKSVRVNHLINSNSVTIDIVMSINGESKTISGEYAGVEYGAGTWTIYPYAGVTCIVDVNPYSSPMFSVDVKNTDGTTFTSSVSLGVVNSSFAFDKTINCTY